MEETKPVENTFWEEISWENVKYNKITREDFLRAKVRHPKLYATFLGSEDSLQFFLFKPITWGEFKDIRKKKIDKETTHEYILNTCLIWPKLEIPDINSLDGGIMLTLIQQILTVSNFLNSPEKALELILEIQ